MIADAGDRSAQSVMVACIRGWFAGSLATAAMLLIWVLATEVTHVEPSEIVAIAIGLPFIWLMIALISLPFVAFIAAPIAALVGRFLRNVPPLNAAIGAVIGLAAAGALQWLLNDWIPFSLTPLPLFAGAIYGAITGYQLTRTHYG